MPVVSDFTLIQESGVNIGDLGTALFEKTFNTDGRHRSSPAFIQLMVKGLTSNAGDAPVRVNNRTIGVIEHQPGDSPNHWSTQVIPFPGDFLNDGNNELEIQAKPNDGGGSFDDFRVQAILCFFHQNA